MARIKAKNLDVEKKLGKKDLNKVRGGGGGRYQPWERSLMPLDTASHYRGAPAKGGRRRAGAVVGG